jgi:hypothetical protein
MNISPIIVWAYETTDGEFKLNCYRCNYEMNEIACKIKCPNCGFAVDCSDM